MSLSYHAFFNKITGEVFFAPAGRHGNFINCVKKLVNYIRYNIPRYYVTHLTLTVEDNVSEVHFDNLHRVIQFINQRLKRTGSDFKYIAVKELQERGAIHYHVLCVYSKPYVFPKSEEVAKSWKLGFVKITAPKLRLGVNKIVGYIGKYIGKGYEYEALDTKKSFTASQIKQIYKLTSPRLDEIMGRFGKTISETFKCSYRKVFKIVDNGFRIAKCLIHEFPSDWVYAGVYREPF